MKYGIQNVRWLSNQAIGRFISLNKHTIGSTVFQGTLYESVLMREISQKLCMTNLERIGGAHDGGVDIVGTWPVNKIYDATTALLGASDIEIPKRSTVNGTRLIPLINKFRENDQVDPLKVLVQCKAFKASKVTPKELRELVGTFTSMVPNSEKDKTIIMMCSPHLLTKDGLKLINNIRLPLIYLRVELLRYIDDQNKFDIENSGKLLNYFENEYATKLLLGCRISEWFKLSMYNNKILN